MASETSETLLLLRSSKRNPTDVAECSNEDFDPGLIRESSRVDSRVGCFEEIGCELNVVDRGRRSLVKDATELEEFLLRGFCRGGGGGGRRGRGWKFDLGLGGWKSMGAGG